MFIVVFLTFTSPSYRITSRWIAFGVLRFKNKSELLRTDFMWMILLKDIVNMPNGTYIKLFLLSNSASREWYVILPLVGKFTYLVSCFDVPRPDTSSEWFEDQLTIKTKYRDVEIRISIIVLVPIRDQINKEQNYLMLQVYYILCHETLRS